MIDYLGIAIGVALAVGINTLRFRWWWLSLKQRRLAPGAHYYAISITNLHNAASINWTSPELAGAWFAEQLAQGFLDPPEPGYNGHLRLDVRPRPPQQ